MKFQFYFFSLIFVSSLLSCESKYVEKAPENVKMYGPSVSERGYQKSYIDEQMEEILDSTEIINMIVQRVEELTVNKAQYKFKITSIIYDSITKLKKTMPYFDQHKLFVRKSSILVYGVKTEVGLATYPLININKNSKIKIADRFAVFIKSNESNKFLPVLLVDKYSKLIKMRFIQSSIESLKSAKLPHALKFDSTCEVELSESKKIESISCKNIILKQHEDTTIVLGDVKVHLKEKWTYSLITFYDKNGLAYHSMPASFNTEGIF